MTLPLVVGRPHEESALFNPAFLAALLNTAAREHGRRSGSRALPLAYAYLIPTLSLHRPTRDALPTSVSTQMAVWTQGNPLLLSDLPSRVQAMRPLVSDACCLALSHGVLTSDGQGFTAGRLRRRSRAVSITADSQQCSDRASFLGRWFADQSDVATTLAMWGLRP